MSFLDDILSKLTDVFQKSKDSNIGKLFSIAATQFDDVNTTLNRMEEWRDIDSAEGKALDRIGEEIVGEFRGASDDEDHRLRIKTKIVANFLAYSDIESMNKIFQSYLKDHYVGSQECWSLNEGTPFDGEPAALFATVKGNGNPYGIPFSYLRPIGTGGIRTHWKYLLETDLTVSDEYERWMYPFELFCGDLIASEELYERVPNDNRLYKSDFELGRGYLSFLQEYPICGTFVAGEVI